MKKRTIALTLICSAMVMAAGCAPKGGTVSSAAETTALETSAAVGTEAPGETSSGAPAESVPGETGTSTGESQISGTISEIKDFMFTLTDENGTAYAIPFDQSAPPAGLSNLKDGDKVTVTYTGTLDEADEFTGSVIAVEKES